eukprot:51725_1
MPIINFDLLYVGNINDAKNELNVLSNFHIEWQLETAQYVYYNTYWDWQSNASPPNYLNAFMFSGLYSLDNLTSNYINIMVESAIENHNIFHNNSVNIDGYYSYMHTIVGGTVNNINEKECSINPSWRNSALYASCLMQWIDDESNEKITNFMNKQADIFGNISMGAYFNEDRYANQIWINSYWQQNNYNRLLNIKRKWNNQSENPLFICHHCVDDQINDVSS